MLNLTRFTLRHSIDIVSHRIAEKLKKLKGKSKSQESGLGVAGAAVINSEDSKLTENQLDLERKYKNELHANEIVLLAYYIAAINIENAYHDATPDPDDGIGKSKYTPFEGIVLTDTFQLGESSDGEKIFSEMFPQNSTRVQKQQKAPLRVIIGNPPYNASGTKASGNTIWQLFVNNSIKLLKPNGYICFVHPNGWRKPNTEKGKFYGLFKKMTNENLYFRRLSTK